MAVKGLRDSVTGEFVLTGARLATMAGTDAPYGLIEDGAVAVSGGRIVWAGPRQKLSADNFSWEQVDLGGRLVTPGLIDCHTHIVFGGNRAMEFEMRLNGASYEEVARAGGGIVSTVSATRTASLEDLVQGALPRLDARYDWLGWSFDPSGVGEYS